MILKSLLFLTLFVNQAWSQSIDMINQARVDHPWIEIGFVDVDTTSWVRVDALGTNYDNAVILTALPDLGGELYTQGFSTATRIRNVVNSGNVHFEVKLFQPNDSFCSKEWYVPIPIGPVEIGYTIVEYGSFFVANKHQFIIGTGLANRTRATLVAKSPDFHPLPYPFGCSAATCVFPQSINLTELGAVATIQSLVYDTYLLLRISSVVRRQIIVVLTPHDSGDPSYFDFPEPETVGFMAFRTGITLDCIERLTVETTRWNNVTSVKLYYPFFWQYVKTPAVFGMVISQNSLVDSMALRVFSRTLTDAYVITQEDVCDEENPIHTTPEFASALVAGESLEGTEICDAIYRAPTNAPTSAPTFAPTSVPTNAPTEAPQCVYNFLLYDLFGDGWQNVKLRVVTDGVTTDYSVVCACDMIEVRSSSCVLDISMVTVEDSGEPITYWEPLWATKINGVTYPGDFRTTMHIEIDVVTVENAPDTDPTSEGNQCKPCTASDDDGNGGNGGGGPPGPGRGRGRGRGRGGDDGPGRGRGGADDGAGRGRGRGGADDGAVGNGNGRGADDGAIGNGNGKGNDDGAAGNGNGKGADDATPGSGNGKGNDDGAAAGNGKGNDDGRGKGADDDKCDEKNGKKCDKQRKLGQGDDGNHNTGIAQFKIFDQFGNGWYKNGGYSSGVCDSELCPNNDDTCVEDTIDLPDILTYPKWYVMNAARTQLVDFGSMCENPKGIEGCMITLPDGRYVFRVAGYNLDGDLASWRFCGIYGVNHQELQFQMVDGVCVPRALLSAEDYCTGFKTLVSLSGSLSIAGVTIDNLNEYDTNALYTQILALFPNTVAVDILDRALVGGYLVVNFVVTVSPEDYGLDGSVSNNIEACLNSVYATAQSESQSHFLTGLTSAIQSSPLGQNDPLAHVTGVTLTSLEVVQVQYVSKDDNSVLHPLEMTYSNNESSVQNGVSIVTIVALVCGAIFMAAATAFTIMRSRGVGHVPLSDKSSHLDNSINKVSVGTSLDIEK